MEERSLLIDSLKIWQVMVAGMPNVNVEASKDHASPITAAYDFIGDKGPLNVGDRLYWALVPKMTTGKDGSVQKNTLRTGKTTRSRKNRS